MSLPETLSTKCFVEWRLKVSGSLPSLRGLSASALMLCVTHLKHRARGGQAEDRRDRVNLTLVETEIRAAPIGAMMAARILVHVRRIKACSPSPIPEDDVEFTRTKNGELAAQCWSVLRDLICVEHQCFSTGTAAVTVAIVFAVTG